MKRAWVALVAVGILGCKDKAKDAAKTKPGAAPVVVEDTKPPIKIEGPAVSPVVTNSITFFVPKDAAWWGEMAFGCYAGVIQLQPGNRPSDAFLKVSPMVEPALKTADIDLDKDLTAIGAWGCGEGACIYLAVQLRDPNKLKAMLEQIMPGQPPKELGKHHWSIDAPGAQGPRVISFRAVPIQWPAKLPADVWSRQAAKATHVVFLTGLFDKTTQVDALAAAADPQTAAARVAEDESLVTDTRGRCIVGHVGKRPFQPGYELERARFMLAAPEGKADALTGLLGSSRSVDLEVELVLNPPPSEKQVKDWIAEARAFVGNIVDGVRAQFAGQGAIVDAMFDLGALLGNRGFKHTLKGNALTLSFRTDRVSQSELMAIEKRLQSAIGAP